MMMDYEMKAQAEFKAWERKIYKKNRLMNRYMKSIQTKINNKIPERIHDIITSSMKQMVKAVLLGSEYTTNPQPLLDISLEEREQKVKEKIKVYQRMASIEGAGTGAGGLLLGAVDFPLLLSIKMKFLFEVASLYGFNVKNYGERVYILLLFQLAYSSDKKRIEVYEKVKNWSETNSLLLTEPFDWQMWQQEYRDHIDLVKLLQLIPGFGAIVGAWANFKLLDELGETAIQGYRLRIFNK